MNHKSIFKRTAALAMATGLSAMYCLPVSAEVKPLPVKPSLTILTEEEKPVSKDKVRNMKTFTKLNNDAVKIYPDAIKRSMHVIAKGNDAVTTDFYVFDLEGTLMKHFKMAPRDHQKIHGLKRGTYIYRVFSGDEETAAGKFEIR
ncbi:MAG: T9SS type A sorting domain-containing protein [Chitinophagaceae bacterium]|nr:T9SS type A sorting domain-containing protein [Chitinophagaceae bacterium]